jgi:hypothetical protein
MARQAHNLKVVGSNPAPAPKVYSMMASRFRGFFVFLGLPLPRLRGGSAKRWWGAPAIVLFFA